MNLVWKILRINKFLKMINYRKINKFKDKIKNK